MTTDRNAFLYTKGTDTSVDAQFAASRKFAKIRLGETMLFWRSALRRYVISLDRVQRIHRRIQSVAGRLCAGGKNFDIEYLVLILHDGTELQLHIGDDEKARAEALLAALKESHPEIRYGKE